MVAPTGDSGGCQTRSALSGQPRTQQRPGTSRAQQKGESTSNGLKSLETKGPSQDSSKRQLSAGGTPEGGQAKRPKQAGQLGYARAAREGLRVAAVSENYPESQLSKENFVDIQWAVGRLVDELPEEGFTPGWSTPTGQKGLTLWSASMKQPRIGWPLGYLPWRPWRAPGSRW